MLHVCVYVCVCMCVCVCVCVCLCVCVLKHQFIKYLHVPRYIGGQYIPKKTTELMNV